MLARRATCQLLLAQPEEDVEEKEKNDDRPEEPQATDPDPERPSTSAGQVTLYQSNDEADVNIAVGIDKAPDGEYLLAFTYNPKNMELYQKILDKKRHGKPKPKPFEKPVLEFQPETTDTTARERCPDRRVIGGINVKKGFGTLILPDSSFNLFDRMWTPVHGVFSLYRGSSKLGNAVFPTEDLLVARGTLELELLNSTTKNSEAALQRAMKPKTLRELVSGHPTNMPVKQVFFCQFVFFFFFLHLHNFAEKMRCPDRNALLVGFMCAGFATSDVR